MGVFCDAFSHLFLHQKGNQTFPAVCINKLMISDCVLFCRLGYTPVFLNKYVSFL